MTFYFHKKKPIYIINSGSMAAMKTKKTILIAAQIPLCSISICNLENNARSHLKLDLKVFKSKPARKSFKYV
jgi:hypothetical protein